MNSKIKKPEPTPRMAEPEHGIACYFTYITRSGSKACLCRGKLLGLLFATKSRETDTRRDGLWGKIKKEETKKVTVTTTPCQSIFSTGLTETKGLSGNKKKKSWQALTDTDTKQMSDIKHCTVKSVGRNTRTYMQFIHQFAVIRPKTTQSNGSHPSSSSWLSLSHYIYQPL